MQSVTRGALPERKLGQTVGGADIGRVARNLGAESEALDLESDMPDVENTTAMEN
jgi:hypothetical protein